MGCSCDPGLDLRRRPPVQLNEYIHDRISETNQIPPLASLVEKAAKELNLGWSWSSAWFHPELLRRYDPALVYEEIQSALQLFRENGFSIIDVTDKTIETSSDEVIKLITRQVR